MRSTASSSSTTSGSGSAARPRGRSTRTSKPNGFYTAEVHNYNVPNGVEHRQQAARRSRLQPRGQRHPIRDRARRHAVRRGVAPLRRVRPAGAGQARHQGDAALRGRGHMAERRVYTNYDFQLSWNWIQRPGRPRHRRPSACTTPSTIKPGHGVRQRDRLVLAAKRISSWTGRGRARPEASAPRSITSSRSSSWRPRRSSGCHELQFVTVLQQAVQGPDREPPRVSTRPSIGGRIK